MGKIVTILLSLPILYAIAIVVASEFGGEVVELETHDFRGGRYTTSLWVVDLYGDTWIRSSDPQSTWLKRLRDDPDVHLIRDGERIAYRAEIVEDFASRINAGMREKYGRADELISTLHDPEEIVAIRLSEP